MIKMRIGAAGLLAGVLFVSAAQAQVAEDAATALKDSAKAIQELKGITYKSRWYGKGGLEKFIDGNGTVKMVRTGVDPKHTPMWVEGEIFEPAKGKTQFTVSTDGTTVWWEDAPANKLLKRPFMDRTDAWTNLNRGQQIVVMELAETTPFSRELKAEKLEVTGTEKVHGETCKVVTASWLNPERSAAWCISVTDNLPRKIELSMGGPSGMIKGTEIWDVKTDPSLKPADLALPLKKGWVLDEQAAPPPPAAKVDQIQNPPAPPPPAELGLRSGTEAPDFELKSADGKSVKLSSMRGKTVVLSFFGTMFTKSDEVNMVAQEVQDSMKDKVKVVGLACREDSDKTVADYAKDKKLTFSVVPKADTIVDPYRVVGFPSLYVINPEGKVAAFFQGAVSKEQVMKAIEAAGKPAGAKPVGDKPGEKSAAK